MKKKPVKPRVPAEGNSPYAMGDRKGENRDSPPSFRAIGFADAQDINRKPRTLYSAGMAAAKLKVIIQNRAKQAETPTKTQFQHWAEAALVTSPAAPEITIRVVDTAESAALNKKFRHKTGPTNVLSFGYAPIPGEDFTSLGDLVICADLVREEAQTEKKPVIAHWAHLTVHGLLHLQGYDHIEPQDAQTMEQLEISILSTLGFADPYHYKEKD
jgi:probable rRNA maturation factor